MEERTQESLDAQAASYFRWRWCPLRKNEMITEAEVPPYFWLHDDNTGEHRSGPK